MSDDVHLSSVFVNASLDAVWKWIADPASFPTIYPNWTSEVNRDSEGRYQGVAPDGEERFEIVPSLNHEHGVVDFEIKGEDGSVELSRARIYPLKSGGCQIVHLAYRWEGITDSFWEEFKVGTDQDLERAKEVIEGGDGGEAQPQTVEPQSDGAQEPPRAAARHVMVDHVSLGVRDLAASRAFYEAALVPLGFGAIFELEGEAVAFGVSEASEAGGESEDFWIGQSELPVTGVHVAFAAPSREAVDAFHITALQAGGRDNGRPGERPEYHEGYYAAYVLDPDANNVEAVHHSLISG